MSRPIKESVLLKTSSANDVQCSGGVISITGLKPVSKKNITSIKQVKYRAEVAQVITVGGTAYVPTDNTTYSVVVTDPFRVYAGYQESQKKYSYTTGTVTGVAATDRETIHVALVAKINADASNHAVAATLGGGAGFTVTDDGGYYPVFAQNMTNVKGINMVYTVTNSDGTGFTDDNFTTTTAGVYSYGVGANLLAEKPVLDYVYGNLISGVLYAPPVTTAGVGATSGQNYDGFVIESLKEADAIGVTGQYAYVERVQTVFVDNGTGSSTTNLTGFNAFERSMLDLLFSTYSEDQRAIIFMGNTAPVCQGLGTGLPGGTTLDENVVNFGNGFSTHYYPLGTATIVSLTGSNLGIVCKLDETNGEGVELSAPTWANSLKNFVVGQTAASIYTKINVNDVSGLNPMWVGFRKQAAANATYTSYTDYAFVGLGNATGDIYTSTENDGGGNTNTDTTQNWADNETHTLEVRVDINGAVTFKIDGYAPTVTQAFSFDAGDTLIPVFCYALQTADIGTPAVLEGAFLTTDSWRN